MNLGGHHERLTATTHAIRFIVATLLALAWGAQCEAKTANVTGVVVTLGADHVQTVWPNARIILKSLDRNTESATISNDLGRFTFYGVVYGSYEITVLLAGFETMTKKLTVEDDHPAELDIQLTLKGQSQTVTVTSEDAGIDFTSSSGGAPTLNASNLKSLVELNQDFQDALPLLPGVVRGIDGLIRISGGRTNQANTLVNSATVADPFTGQPALSLPAVAVQSVQVLANPFSSEYGRFSSGVVDLSTRGGTDEWKYLFEDPVPRFRWIDHRHTHGVESASPHLTFAGPLVKGKAYIFQASGYGYDTVTVPSLPNPDNVRVVEKLSSYTQLDWNPSISHRLTAVLAFDPQNTDYANINTFNPQPVTANDRERDYFLSLTHRWIFANGGFLQSLFAAKQLDSHIHPATPAREMTLAPDQNSGGYFEQQQRNTQLYQWSQAMHWRPMQHAGRHLLTLGYSYAYSSYDGQVANYPVQVLRQDGTLSRRISYPDGTLPSQAAKNEFAIFVQDGWQIHPRLTLDLGLRLDHDSLSSEPVNVAPRIGFVFAPTSDRRTAIRGGFGVFFDKIPINVAIFNRLPAQTITTYDPDGSTPLVASATFSHIAPTLLHVPYSLGWTLQFDRELRHDLFIRLGYEERHVSREFYVTPSSSANVSQLLLLNRGKQSYREFLTMLRWRVNERSTVFASYVHSRAYGELNDYNQFFGNFPYPLIRPNQRGPLSSDAPDRGLFWNIIGLPHKFDFIPILDVHTGFPHSRVNQDWDFVGAENRAGRFPVFLALDTKIQYPVDFTFRGHRIQFRAGLTVYNVLNHFNPRDVQQYEASPNYGAFYNSIGRLFRIDGDFTF
jgi:hypothetical protein